ncbi:MAG: DUF4367 domain-containing protein [Anaerolineae bacterium]|jgi:hypothetical protein
MDRDERLRAERVSAEVDRLIEGAEVRPEGLDPEEAGLVETARRLARLPALMGPVDPGLERRVMRQARAAQQQPTRRQARWRWAWAAAGLAAVLLLALLISPAGQTAVASFLAVFDLGRTELQVSQVGTPTVTSGAQAIRQTMSLAEAEAQFPFAIPRPAYLPAGYRLREVNGYSYPDLPAWMPQPFFVELIYDDDGGATCTLRVYPIMIGQEGNISSLNLAATSIGEVEDVEVGGQAGVLLRLEGNWREVVWEQGDLILSLSAEDLVREDLLRVAGSVESGEQK